MDLLNRIARGDVLGPTSSTDNAIARFNGITGKVIQNSDVALEDNGDIIGKSFVGTRSGVVSRDGEGLVSQIDLAGGRTLIISRDVNSQVQSVTDGTRTWTINRDVNGAVSDWVVS